MSSALLIVLAVIPGIVLGVMVYRLDKIDKESPKVLALLFVFGALSCIPAIILEMLGEKVIQYLFPQNTHIYMLVENIIGVACVEEAGKYVALRTTWKKPDFNYRFDAVVYSVMVTLGFAIFENISYAFSYGLATTISRAFTAVPAHTIFGIFMGHYYGQAKYWLYHSDKKKCTTNLWLAFLVPVLLHGFYDYFASEGTALSTLLFISLVIAMDIVSIIKIRKYSREDTPIAPWDSSIPVVGWFPEDGKTPQPVSVSPYSNGSQPNPAYIYNTGNPIPPQGYAPQPQQGYMTQPVAQNQYATPAPQPVPQPSMQNQYANPTVRPVMQNQYANSAARPQEVYNSALANNYVNSVPVPNHGYTPSRAYLHAEANLENLSDEGYSLNSFVEKDSTTGN